MPYLGDVNYAFDRTGFLLVSIQNPGVNQDGRSSQAKYQNWDQTGRSTDACKDLYTFCTACDYWPRLITVNDSPT